MADSAADVITEALTHHRPLSGNRCECRTLIAIGMGDRWEAHLADVTVAALTQAGHLTTHPGARTDYTTEAHWRTAALNVVATYTHEPIPHATVGEAQQDTLRWAWPSLATALDRLVKAKRDLLKEHP